MAGKGMAGKGIGATGTGASKSAPKTSKAPKSLGPAKARRQPGIPDAVANRMARRIAIATGIPTLMGMGVFIGSYLLVTRQIVELSTGVTLTASGGCFLLGVLGLSYGVLSASWEAEPGTLLGSEQIGVNISRIRGSIRAMRDPSRPNPASMPKPEDR
ncbi:PAM68 family protein [Cyanobium sp. WAJ14-Wanaka]|uniref:PAM68 family protein n=1 Tax=Cyanobium sp. WAJ14-Wanaka TaxID=2823725 RepID=UPI0020CD463A|nr:PAM68 family protein [Cyanobium sp. WAJ14-Wanaka]